MATLRTVLGVADLLLVLLVCVPGLAAQDSGAKDAAEPFPSQALTPQEAQNAEEQLKTNPDDFSLHAQLVRYYFEAMIKEQSDEVEKARERHIFWLIEHHPESEIAGSGFASIQPVVIGSMESYQHGKELWLEQAANYPSDAQVLRHAGKYLGRDDKKLARELLEKSWALAPGDARTAQLLAHGYSLESSRAKTAEEKAALSGKALAIYERALEGLAGVERTYLLTDAATAAFEAGEIEKAERYANELVGTVQSARGDWNYGNAIHKGHIVLGRVALRREDLEGAKKHLLAAGETPGSPQLNTFGPSMTLANELLDRGERETVLTYLGSCQGFWKMGTEQLNGWIATIKIGGRPDFGPNLLY